jgi:hypothetical protein
MKKTLALAAILAGLITVALPAPAVKADVAVSFSFFHDNLAPYGRWVTVGTYGRAWYPVGVPVGWQPYTVGHWGWGDYGWTWVSADPWGDWTYRYGTWTFQPPYGWVWVPGYVWAPAWVTWSYTNDYIGWAPIPPTFSFSVTGYFGSPVVANRSWYCFVPKRRFHSGNVHQVRVPVHQNQVILASSKKVTRFPVKGGVVRNEGIDIRNVERASAARVQRVSTHQMRAAPARIEPARTSGKRIAVASPATTREDSGRVEKSRPEKEVRREKATRPSNTRPKRDQAPAPDVRRAPEPRPASVREREASQPPQTRKAKPSDSEVKRPARPSSSREKSRAVRASAPREPASSAKRPEKSSEKRSEPSKPRSKPKPKPKPNEKERGRS